MSLNHLYHEKNNILITSIQRALFTFLSSKEIRMESVTGRCAGQDGPSGDHHAWLASPGCVAGPGESSDAMEI